MTPADEAHAPDDTSYAPSTESAVHFISLDSPEAEALAHHLKNGGRCGLHRSWPRRVTERVVAAVLLVTLSPVMLLIWLAVRVESHGRAVFRQERLGANRRPFAMLKFRTMRVDGLTGDEPPQWANQERHRVTGIGRVLRATGLDELPQLVNVLRGEMQFIGIRPIREKVADALADEIPHYHVRFAAPPGVTGWAQVMYDYAGSVEGQRRKLEFEMYFLKRAGPRLDSIIMLRTVAMLLQRSVGRSMPEAPAIHSNESGEQAPAPGRPPDRRDTHPSQPETA